MRAEFKNFYATTHHRVFNTWCKRTQRLDTYGCGCAHDCKYCYAKGLLEFRGFWDKDNPKMAYISEVENVINELDENEVIRLGGMTDCFQPIEKTERVTYNSIKILNRHRINYLIVTKSNLVASDEYISIYDKSLAHFQITITATSDWKSIEYENAPTTSARIKAIEKLQSLDFDVSVRLSPLIEENIDFEFLKTINCDKILIEFLKVNHWIRKRFNIDYSKYTLKYGGYDNLQLEDKIKIVEKITGFKQVSVGEYVKAHHEYFSKNVNYNKDDCCNLRLEQIKCPTYGEQKCMNFSI